MVSQYYDCWIVLRSQCCSQEPEAKTREERQETAGKRSGMPSVAAHCCFQHFGLVLQMLAVHVVATPYLSSTVLLY